MKKVAYKYGHYTKLRSGQIRSPNQMLHESRETHVLWVNRDAEFDGDINFGIWPKEGQRHVKPGQTRSNIQIQNFIAKNAGLVQFCLRIPCMSFILCRTIRNAKKCISFE